MTETPDLRALLGDTTFPTVDKAARAMYEHRTEWGPDSQPWNLLDVSEVGEYRDIAAVVLAAVLPDLLAHAWDEGYEVGWDDLQERATGDRRRANTPNPYRKADR